MGVCWKMDCVDARLRFAATPGCGQKLGRPSQKSGLGMAELSLQTPSAVIKWHSMKFNIPRGSREQVIWEMSGQWRTIRGFRSTRDSGTFRSIKLGMVLDASTRKSRTDSLRLVSEEGGLSTIGLPSRWQRDLHCPRLCSLCGSRAAGAPRRASGAGRSEAGDGGRDA